MSLNTINPVEKDKDRDVFSLRLLTVSVSDGIGFVYPVPATLRAKERDPMEPWMTWIDSLNALAGRTLVEVAACQDCGRARPCGIGWRG